MTKTKIPKSRAKTAYGLLSEVCRVIAEEPRRYCQRIFIKRGEPEAVVEDVAFDLGFPSCGTVGCVAGWVATLRNPERQFSYFGTSVLAQKALGLTNAQTYELFDGYAVDGPMQTAIHAQNGIAHIKRFQAKYKTRLKAKRLEPIR